MCFIICLPFTCIRAIITVIFGACGWVFLKKSKKETIEAEKRVLPQFFDSSSEVSSDSVSTDEETRKEEAKHMWKTLAQKQRAILR
jgi:hypothetical protein